MMMKNDFVYSGMFQREKEGEHPVFKNALSLSREVAGTVLNNRPGNASFSLPVYEMLCDLVKGKAFLSYDKMKVYAEIKTDEGVFASIYNTSGNKFSFVQIDQNGILHGVKKGNFFYRILLLTVFGICMKSSSEIEDILSANDHELEKLLRLDESSPDMVVGDNLRTVQVGVMKITDHIYTRLRYPEDCQNKGLNISVAVYDSGEVPKLRDSSRKMSEEATTKFGTPMFFESALTVNNIQRQKGASITGKYAFSKRTFSEEEKNKIPVVPTWYEETEVVKDTAIMMKETSDFPSPIRTAFFVGPAGTGKTFSANMVFAELGLPGDHYTCNAQTEIFDFLGQIFPSNGNSQKLSYEDVRVSLGLPSTDDIMMDPKGSFKIIHKDKEIPEFIDEGKLIVEMIEKVTGEIAKMVSETSNGFTYVESGLIRAIRNGYGFEIQEIGSVQRAGVVVGLNALLESGDNAYITLPTGETIKKHPECVIIFTSNSDYEGCENVNQSVLSRMALVHVMPNPSAKIMAERVAARVPFKDMAVLNRMADTIETISKYCKENGIDDGVCGPRELENWAMRVIVKAKISNTDFYDDALIGEAGVVTVLNKSSQNEDDRAEIESVYRKDWAY